MTFSATDKNEHITHCFIQAMYYWYIGSEFTADNVLRYAVYLLDNSYHIGDA